MIVESNGDWRNGFNKGYLAMSVRQVLFYVGCAIAWFVLLPLFVVVGGIALFAYAVFSEITVLFTGEPKEKVDSSTARELARQVCLGN